MTLEEVDVSIKWPFKWCLVGSSGSGKTQFSLDVIANAFRLFDTPPSKVIIVYKEFQDIYTKFNEYIPTTLYKEDDIDLEEITKMNQEKLLIICDDLYFSKKINEVAEQFLVKGRHRNTSWIVLTQSIFNHTALKNISRNSTHITLFKSVRLNEPHIFFSQLRPQSSKVLQDIYKESTVNSYSYLDIDLSQTCPDNLRYKTDILKDIVKVFVIMNNKTFKTMYLVNKHDLDSKLNKNFSLSLQNKDVCQGGLNVSVKPIKTKSKAHKKNMINANTQTSQEKIDGDGEDDRNNDDDDDDDDDDGYIRRVFEKDRNFPQRDTSRDMNSEISKANYSPNQNPVIEDGKKYPEFSKDNRIAHPFTQRQESGNYPDISQDARLRNIWKNRSPRKLYRKHLVKSSKSGNRLTQKFKKKSKHNYKKLYASIFTKKSQNGPSRALTYVPADEPVEKASEGEQSDKVDSITISGVNEHDSDVNNNFTEQTDSTDANEDSQMRNIDNRNSWENSSQSANEFETKKFNSQNDEWFGGLKSRLKDRRVQFKRKQDQIGFRINPTDASSSLIKPSEIHYLNPDQSTEYIDKWKSLDEVKAKQFRKKRFTSY